MAKIYMNQMQREAALYRANKTVVCAGRGTGKGLLHAAVIRFSSKAFVSQVAAYAFRTLTVCYEDDGLFVA